MEKVVPDKFLRGLPHEELKAVGLSNPQTPREVSIALGWAPATLAMGNGEKKEQTFSPRGGEGEYPDLRTHPQPCSPTMKISPMLKVDPLPQLIPSLFYPGS